MPSRKAITPPVDAPPVPPDETEALRVDARFVEISKTYGKETEKRLNDLYSIWKNPIDDEGRIQRLRMDEIAELRKFGILQTQLQESGLLENNAITAEYVSKTYSYPCTRDLLKRWTNGQTKPPIGNLRFPSPDSAGRRKQADVDDWCKVSLPNTGNTNASGGVSKDARQRKEEAEMITAEVAARKALREEDARWIMKDEAQMTTTGAVLKYHSIVKNHLEELPKKLNPAQFTEDQIQQVRFACNQKLQDIESDAEAYKP